MFITQTANSAGIYLVRFFLNGQERPVIIDDYLPVYSSGQPAFAKCRDGELWVSLLEKAWAKLHGSYARSSGHLPSRAATHIMGVPAENLRHSENIQDPGKFFERMKEADRRGYTLMAKTPGEGMIKNALGLLSGHIYSVISTFEFYTG